MRKHEETFRNYNDALALYRTLGDRPGEAKTLTKIGVAHDNLGDRPHALESFNQAVIVYRAIGDHAEANLTSVALENHYPGEKQKAVETYGLVAAAYHSAGTCRMWRGVAEVSITERPGGRGRDPEQHRLGL